MSGRAFPQFPIQALATFVFALAVTAVAAALTILLGDTWLLWFKARDYVAARCTIESIAENRDAATFAYSYHDVNYRASQIAIANDDYLRIAQGAIHVGAQTECWVNPGQPSQALLDRSYDGWWWLPALWGFAVFLLIGGLRGRGDLWRWLAFKPDPALTWAKWRRSFYQGNAWASTLVGATLLLPGLLGIKVITFDPWWNWRQAQEWPAVNCVMVEGTVRYTRGGSFHSRGGYVMDIAFAYQVGGRQYVSRTYSPWHIGHTDWIQHPPRRVEKGNAARGEVVELTKTLALGTAHTCYVAPTAPEHAYMNRGWWDGWYAFGLIGPGFAIVGLLIIMARPRYFAGATRRAP